MDKRNRIEHYKNLIADIDKQIDSNRNHQRVLDLAREHLKSIEPMLNEFVHDPGIFPACKPVGVLRDNNIYMDELDYVANSYISLNILLDDISDAFLHIADDLEE